MAVMLQILATPLEHLGLEMTFSAESNEFGLVSTVDLIPGGQEIPVTDENKHEYVKLLAHHRMTTAIRRQIDAFLEGFHELVPPELVSLFDAQVGVICHCHCHRIT
jgi:E3 ubiquitin-protein ligase HUWE1